ncbi:IS3 family transposase [Bacillus cereus]|uniref:IS3 family transposase n=1 Tax=Bacillus cereus TaxID=1396 RepID=UPI001D137285|nr:IS3 family transposase [Bacillus cereus]
MILIQNIYDEQKESYRYRRIRDKLMNQGYKFNHKKIQRIMKGTSLKSLVCIKKYVLIKKK